MLPDEEVLEMIGKYRSVDKKKQKEIINAFRNSEMVSEEQLKYLVRYGNLKSGWWAQSEIIVELGYERMKKYLPQIYKWLEDINSPGAISISDDFLLQLDRQILIKSLSDALHRAGKDIYDDCWLYSLTVLAEEAGLTEEDFIASGYENAYEIIEKYKIWDSQKGGYDPRDTYSAKLMESDPTKQ